MMGYKRTRGMGLIAICLIPLGCAKGLTTEFAARSGPSDEIPHPIVAPKSAAEAPIESTESSTVKEIYNSGASGNDRDSAIDSDQTLLHLKGNILIVQVKADLSPLLKNQKSVILEGEILDSPGEIRSSPQCGISSFGNSISSSITLGTKIEFTEFEQNIQYSGSVPELRGRSVVDLISRTSKLKLHCEKSDGRSYAKTDFTIKDLISAFGKYASISTLASVKVRP